MRTFNTEKACLKSSINIHSHHLIVELYYYSNLSVASYCRHDLRPPSPLMLCLVLSQEGSQILQFGQLLSKSCNIDSVSMVVEELHCQWDSDAEMVGSR